MRTATVRGGDLVLVEDRRGDTYLGLVLGREARKLKVRPLRAQADELVPGTRVVEHYKRRADAGRTTRELVNAVSRIRYRFGVRAEQVAAESAIVEATR